MENLAEEDSLGQECVDTFLPVHQLGDPQIDGFWDLILRAHPI